MRTTITLDPETEILVRRAMRERGIPFKQAVNDAIRAGLTPLREGGAPAAQTPSFPMGFEPTLPWDKALRMASDIEDEELARRLTRRR